MMLNMQLDGITLFEGLASGAQEVIQNKHHLNKINVFPVADGDTGTNLAATLSETIGNTTVDGHVGQMLRSIADAAMMSARGNSGTIFAQFLYGMSVAQSEGTEKLTKSQFINMMKIAAGHAKEAVSTPVPGTMISVMEDWAHRLDELGEKSEDVTELVHASIDVAEHALLKTTEQMPLLKKNGVVDAGAKGFVLFLKGFVHYLKTGQRTEHIEEDVTWEVPVHDVQNVCSDERWCTEAVLENTEISTKEMEQILLKYGNSGVVAGGQRKMKIHVHTSKPMELFHELRKVGTVCTQKLDDMHLQQSIIKNRKGKVAIVTDSIADIPEKLIKEYQIFQVPIEISLGEERFLDRITISATSLYDKVRNTKIKGSSSQPSRQSIRNLYTYLSTYYSEILVLSVSGKMSGTFEAFTKAAEVVDSEKVKIEVIDSKLNSAAQGLLVKKAAEMSVNGANIAEISTKMKSMVKNTKIYVSVSELDGMIRQGRISKTAGTVAGLLNLKPIVSIDEEGNGAVIGKAFSMKENSKQIKKLVQKAHEEHGIEEFAIVHGNANERLDKWVVEMKQIIGKEPVFVQEVSSVVALSASENTIAIAFTTKEKNHGEYVSI
ncbi:MAG: DegV family protein [Bacilli bacterium]